MDIGPLGNFPLSQVAGCRGTLLAENSPISLAGSEEQINFSQQSPKMLKTASESFIHDFFIVFRSFSPNFPLGAPVFYSQFAFNFKGISKCFGEFRFRDVLKRGI